jgi:hypothetical protein
MKHSDNLFRDETNTPSWLERNGLVLAVIAANVFIVIGEWRVYDLALRVTHSLQLAWVSAGTVGLPFLLYETLWKRRFNNEAQMKLVTVAGGVTLALTGILGIWDYFAANASHLPPSFVTGAIAAALSGHVFVLLRYILLDETIKALRITSREEARIDHEIKKLELARRMAEKVKGYSDDRERLYRDHDPEVVGRLEERLGGKQPPNGQSPRK